MEENNDENELDKKSNIFIIALRRAVVIICILILLIIGILYIYLGKDSLYSSELEETIKFSCSSYINLMPSGDGTKKITGAPIRISISIDMDEFLEVYEVVEIKVNGKKFEGDDITYNSSNFGVTYKNYDIENKTTVKVKIKNINTNKKYTYNFKVQTSYVY